MLCSVQFFNRSQLFIYLFYKNQSQL